ncbi:MAG: hypothetical protein GYB33_21575 [Gammaproteobacteria bacterium]|nr:hypothetical protein [Gammaproteobacteria bacterium]
MHRRTHISAWLLLAFLLTRACMPAGFMPAALGQGGPVALCPGDLRSARLLALLADDQPHHHQHAEHDPSGGHDGNHGHSAGDFGCEFSVPGVDSALADTWLDALTPAPVSAPLVSWRPLRLTPLAYRLPLSRAPPPPSALG